MSASVHFIHLFTPSWMHFYWFLANPSSLSKLVYLCITSKMLLVSVTYFLRFYWKPFEIVRKITNFLSTKYRRITRKELNIFDRKCLRCHFLSSVHLDLGWHFALCSMAQFSYQMWKSPFSLYCSGRLLLLSSIFFKWLKDPVLQTSHR